MKHAGENRRSQKSTTPQVLGDRMPESTAITVLDASATSGSGASGKAAARPGAACSNSEGTVRVVVLERGGNQPDERRWPPKDNALLAHFGGTRPCYDSPAQAQKPCRPSPRQTHAGIRN